MEPTQQNAVCQAAATSHSQPQAAGASTASGCLQQQKPKGTGFFQPRTGRSLPSRGSSLGGPVASAAPSHHRLQPTHSTGCCSFDGSRTDAGMQQPGQMRPLQQQQQHQQQQASPFALAQMAGQHILAPCSAGAQQQQQQPLFQATAAAFSNGLGAPQLSCSSSGTFVQLPGAWTPGHLNPPADQLLQTALPGGGMIATAPAACNLHAPVHIDSSTLCGTHLAAAAGCAEQQQQQLPGAAALVVGPCAATPAAAVPVLASNTGMMQHAGSLCVGTVSTAGPSGGLFLQPGGVLGPPAAAAASAAAAGAAAAGGPMPQQHMLGCSYTAPAAAGCELLSGPLDALSRVSHAHNSGRLFVADQLVLCQAQHRGEQIELAQQQDDIQQQIDQLHLLQQLLHIRKQHKLQRSMRAQAQQQQQQQQHGQFVSAPRLQLLAGDSIDPGSGAILQQQQQQQPGGLSLSAGGLGDAVLATLLQPEPQQQYVLAQQQQQQQLGGLFSEQPVADFMAHSVPQVAARGWQHHQQQQQQWMVVNSGGQLACTTNSVLLSGSRPLGP